MCLRLGLGCRLEFILYVRISIRVRVGKYWNILGNQFL